MLSRWLFDNFNFVFRDDVINSTLVYLVIYKMQAIGKLEIKFII